jgi:class 3 adenylate cyclase
MPATLDLKHLQICLGSGELFGVLGDEGGPPAYEQRCRWVDCPNQGRSWHQPHTESMPEPLHVRVGLNAGEPIEEDGDLFGSTVILASRIAAKAGASEILVPDTVRGLLSGKGFIFGDRGEFVPKGFDESMRLWDVRWQE